MSAGSDSVNRSEVLKEMQGIVDQLSDEGIGGSTLDIVKHNLKEMEKGGRDLRSQGILSALPST